MTQYSNQGIVSFTIEEMILMKTLEQAVEVGAYLSWAYHCPECGCDWYVNHNLLGEGYRVCFNCEQEYWTDIVYEHSVERRELV